MMLPFHSHTKSRCGEEDKIFKSHKARQFAEADDHAASNSPGKYHGHSRSAR